MAGRTPANTPAVTALLANFEEERQQRRFLIGLLMAFVAVVEVVLADRGEESYAGAFEDLPRTKGPRVNTLTFLTADGTKIGVRGYYTKAEHVIHNSLRRYDYPNAAPHATQAWHQHQAMLISLLAMDADERRAVADGVWSAIVDMPEFQRRSLAAASPRPFATVLTDFPGTQKGEPAGAILQGLAFAYYRADSPNVTIETGKVGAGSRTRGRVGDVDGWNGPDLVLSIEVKDTDVTDPKDPALDSFIANLAEWPDATAVVVAKSATQEVMDELKSQSISVLTRDLMNDNVARWDLNKQRLAAREFYYYLVRVQQNSKLIERFEAFIAEAGIDLSSSA